MARVLVVGGYGAFGALVSERLARDPDLELIVAGRSAARAANAAALLSQRSGRRISHALLDAISPDVQVLQELRPDVLINASGPFQIQDYALARAAIAAGCHYVDLADARSFVTGIETLDEAAKRAGVLVTSGASSVPALTVAAIDSLRSKFDAFTAVTHGITPANSYDPGPATTASILGALGRGFTTPIDGTPRTVHAWQGLRSYRFAALGQRLLSNCEVPDLDVLPRRYSGLRTVRFFAGLEVPLFHLGLWALSWPCRYGLIPRPERLAGPLLWVKRNLAWLGSEAGGMFIVLEGTNATGDATRISWHLIARRGHGPYIPATPSVLVTKGLIAGTIGARGAMPCAGLFSLEDFMAEIRDLDISAHVTAQPD